tara:strand:+ start:2696 stop:3472 length:777 start_codon:yes stop_codon:yes gene_type:complete
MIKYSKIYEGKVIHTRFKPKKHHFKYKVFSLLIDLDEIEELDNNLKLFSYNKLNLISFFNKDHGDRDGGNLKEWVKENLTKKNIKFENIRVEILCYPRIFGYVFNPLSILFIYNEKNELISIFYEVKNTFGEQHTYIFKTNNENLIKNKCSKKFYVSPFIEMDCEYNFSVTKPSDSISVIINQNDKEGKLLYASQDGKVKDLTNKNLIFNYLKHPLMTFKVIVAIHYEAFKLWTKKVKLVKKKIKILNKITFETNEYK